MMMDMPLWAEIIVSLLLVIAGFFAFTGSLGLIRLRDFYSRIHAPTLGNTLASFCVVVAIIVTAFFTEDRFVAHTLLVSFFLIITSPITAMLLMRAAIKRDVLRELQKQSEKARGRASDQPDAPAQASSDRAADPVK